MTVTVRTVYMWGNSNKGCCRTCMCIVANRVLSIGSTGRGRQPLLPGLVLYSTLVESIAGHNIVPSPRIFFPLSQTS